LTPLGKPLQSAVTLVNPLIPLQTKDVFEKLGFALNFRRESSLDPDNAATWQNDLAAPAVQLLPQISHALDALELQQVFHTIRMSGSGATCFGLADDLNAAEQACSRISQVHPDWWVAASTLS
jgi:4-diphosphocytidyl-2-C-methyl-D-erythritol kinase